MEQKAALKQRLADDLKQAMKAGDTARRDAIRFLMASIKNVEIAKQATLDDAGVLGVIAREVRQRQESIESFREGNRPDLVAKEAAEMAVLQGYLPEPISRDEIVAAARQVITEAGAQGPGDKGKVMPRLMAQLKGKADGRLINEVVTELLNK
jgi:uncharacterized protein YqeY